MSSNVDLWKCSSARPDDVRARLGHLREGGADLDREQLVYEQLNVPRSLFSLYFDNLSLRLWFCVVRLRGGRVENCRRWWCSVPLFLRKVAGSSPTLTATYGPWASPLLVVACMTWRDALRGCLAVKFDSCNNLLSSVHTCTSHVNILQCVRLYVKRKYYIRLLDNQ